MIIKSMKIENIYESVFGLELALSRWPTAKEREEFEEWAEEHNIGDYIRLLTYRPVEENSCASILPVIHVHPDAPETVKSMCLLRWS